jgi:NTP pyrophosphatase (non-canonical NTP hydrolase)
VKERSWERYHTPKNLAMSIAIEAAELMERFQWVSSDESIELVKDAGARAAVADELADVLIYCLSLSNQADIDLSAAVLAKLERNEDRFPIGYDPT